MDNEEANKSSNTTNNTVNEANNDGASDVGSTNVEGEKGKPAQVARGTQACSGCRHSKIKCTPGSSTVVFPCKRCISLGVVCEVLKHNRGRKRKVTGDDQPPPKKPQATLYHTDPASLAALHADGTTNPSTPDESTYHGSTSGGSPISKPADPRSNLHILEQAIAMHDGQRPPPPQDGSSSNGHNASIHNPRIVTIKSEFPDQQNMAQLPRVASVPGNPSPARSPASTNSAAFPGLSPLITNNNSSSNGSNGGNGSNEGSMRSSVPGSASARGGESSARFQSFSQASSGSQQSPLTGTSTTSFDSPNQSRNHLNQPVQPFYSPSFNSPLHQQQQQQSSRLQGQQPSSSSSSAQYQESSHLPPTSNLAYSTNPDPARSYTRIPGQAQSLTQHASTSYGRQQPTNQHQLTNNYSHRYSSASESINGQLPALSSIAPVGTSQYGGTMPSNANVPGSNLSGPVAATSILPPPVIAHNASSTSGSISGSTSHSTNTNLESIKFPFLLPKDDRPGRRGIFTLKSLINPKDQGGFSRGDEQYQQSARQRQGPTNSNGDGDESMMLEEEEGSEEGIGPGAQSLQQTEADLLAQDPIEAGVLSVEDAKTLFKLYMDEMSVMNCLLDKTVHTHDFVRAKSSFLYTAILSVISRYLNSTVHTAEGTPKRLISPVYAYCKKALQAHLKHVLGTIEISLEVVQGLAILCYHKEVEDEKSCLHLTRAIAIAREIGIDATPRKPREGASNEEKQWQRIHKRIWMSLFIANTILTMQFDMKTMIGHDDPIIATSSRFSIGSDSPADTLLAANIQLRRLWHVYTEMLRALDIQGEVVGDKSAKLLSLSMITRTANKELETTAADWKEECEAVGLGKVDMKINVWLAAIKLKLNLAIVQMVLPGLKEKSVWSSFAPPRKAGEQRGRILELGCISAFHQAVNSACMILQYMVTLEEKRLLSFAADTFLHFAIYSAFFLWTLCRNTGNNELLNSGEVEHCYLLINNAIRALESASLYPGDSPALHARFLRTLLQSSSPQHSETSLPTASPSVMQRNAAQLPSFNNPTLLGATTPASFPTRNLPSPIENMHNNLSIGQTPSSGLTFSPVSHNSAPFSMASAFATPDLASDPALLSGAGYDAILTADFTAMQKDFPWAFNDSDLMPTSFSKGFDNTSSSGGMSNLHHSPKHSSSI